MATKRTLLTPILMLVGSMLLLSGVAHAQQETREHADDAFEALAAEEDQRQPAPKSEEAATAAKKKQNTDEQTASIDEQADVAASDGDPPEQPADTLHRELDRSERHEAHTAPLAGAAHELGRGDPLGEALGLSASATPLTPVVFGFDFVPMVGTSSAMLGNDERRLSLNLVGGLSGGIHGIEAGAAFNLVRRDVRGVQAAGALNLIGGSVRGAQAAGALNLAFGSLRGVQAAGAFNLANGRVRGLQGAGAGNLAIGDVLGAQGAGAANVATGDLRGVQAAGALNIALGTVRGLQAAGALNVAGSVERGAQVGTVNFSAGDVKGLQLGVVNIAENADAAIGIFNILWGGTWDMEMSGGDTGIYSLAVRNGGRRTHSYLTAGVHPGGKRKVYAVGIGLGVHAQIAESLQIDLDLLAKGLHRGASTDIGDQEDGLLSTARALLVWQALDGIALVGGPSYNVLVTERLRPSRFALGEVEQSEETVHLDDGRHGNVFSWPGFEVGLRFAIN